MQNQEEGEEEPHQLVVHVESVEKKAIGQENVQKHLNEGQKEQIEEEEEGQEEREEEEGPEEDWDMKQKEMEIK